MADTRYRMRWMLIRDFRLLRRWTVWWPTYIVTSGGPASECWEENPLSYAEMADRELIRSGIPKERIIVAPSKSVKLDAPMNLLWPYLTHFSVGTLSLKHSMSLRLVPTPGGAVWFSPRLKDR